MESSAFKQNHGATSRRPTALLQRHERVLNDIVIPLVCFSDRAVWALYQAPTRRIHTCFLCWWLDVFFTMGNNMANRPRQRVEDEIPPPPEFEMSFSRHFATWLHEQRVSLAFTNPPQKLFLIGLKPNGQLSVFERTFLRCLGIAAQGTRSLYVNSRYQIWHLEDSLNPGEVLGEGYDRRYIPRKVYTTGSVGTHDVAVDSDGRVLFVNTRFGCLATVSDEYSFIPLWRPPFLPQILPGDRCHLNGLAMKDGRPAYMTSVSQTHEFDSWRDHRRAGGVVIDIAANEVILTGLSMPHSPRYYNGKLWVANAGTGQLGYVDSQAGRFEPIVFCPGFLRGLCFIGHYAIVGSSQPRHGDIYSGLELDETLQRRNMKPRLGLFIIDLRSGTIAHWMFIEGAVRELYDVVALPAVRQPMALGLLTDEIEKTLYYPEQTSGL